jgi:hypothetical protein
MNLNDKDYEDFFSAYRKLPIKFKIGNFEIRDLNYLSVAEKLKNRFYAFPSKMKYNKK